MVVGWGCVVVVGGAERVEIGGSGIEGCLIGGRIGLVAAMVRRLARVRMVGRGRMVVGF